MEFDFYTFNENLYEEVATARKLVVELEELLDRSWNLNNTGKLDDITHKLIQNEMDLTRLGLNSTLLQLKAKLIFAFELLSTNRLADEILSGWESMKEDELRVYPYLETLYSPALIFLERYVSVFQSQIKSTEEFNILNRINDLERVLRGTPKVIRDRKIIPSNEADVQREIYSLLIHFFPDTIREFPIPSIVKTYKPDFGIKSLKCAIEYKFVTDETEAKKVVGGIYEDVHAYSNSEDWKTFYAVIYMNDLYYTQDQIEADFQASNIPDNWKPIIVYGKGQRNRQKVLPKKKDA